MSPTRISAIAIALALCLGAAELEGQAATERYIPVGQSPGLSGVLTYLGEIVSVDELGQTVSVQTEGQARSISLTPETHIWLDLSLLRRPNTTGNTSDLRVGRTIEVRYVDDESTGGAYWIKVAIEQE